MSMRIVAVLFVLVCAGSSVAQADDAYRFVTEYVRQLGTLERLRESAEVENKKDQGNIQAVMMNCVRNSERFQLQLREYMSVLPKFKLQQQVQAVTTGIAKFYEYKYKIWQEISKNCSEFLTQRDGVDYQLLAANAPKLTAQLEYLDKSIFETVPLVFASLINPREDKEKHLSHIVITKAERDTLVRSLNSYFGKKLLAVDQNYTVSSASVLRSYLIEKGYKTSDEPW
jgi:hypothetical protein